MKTNKMTAITFLVTGGLVVVFSSIATADDKTTHGSRYGSNNSKFLRLDNVVEQPHNAISSNEPS